MQTSALNGNFSSAPLRARWSRDNSPPSTGEPQDGFKAGDAKVGELEREILELREEVAQLKSEQSPIRLDPQNDRASIVDLKTADFHVHRLDLKMSAMSEFFEESTSLEKLLEMGNSGGALPIDFDDLMTSPLEIEAMKISLPGETLLRSTEMVGEESLKQNDIKDLRLEATQGDALRIRGKVDKLIDIPFDIQGKLAVAEDNKIEFSLGKSKVFGVLPLPGLVKQIVARVAGKSMEEMGVEQRGTTFIMDADDFLPEQIKVRLTRVGTENGRLVLEGTKPKETEPQPQAVPTTLVQF